MADENNFENNSVFIKKNTFGTLYQYILYNTRPYMT